MAGFELKPAQREAVYQTATPILVSAAAGSGKTRVLVERLLRQVCDPEKPCNVDDFLVITFTERAAGELRTRITKELNKRLTVSPEDKHLLKQLNRVYIAQISTIHAFCSRLLREYAHELDIPADFRQLSDNESAQLRGKVMTKLLEKHYENIRNEPELSELINTLGAGRDDRSIPELLGRVYDTVQCHLSPDKWIEACLQGLTSAQPLVSTPWGQELIGAFRAKLSLSEIRLKAALAFAREDAELTKNREALLQEDLAAVQRLLRTEDWDELCDAAAALSYPRLNGRKKSEDEQLFEQIKALRNAARKNTEKAVKVFSRPAAELVDGLAQTEPAIRGLFMLEREFSAAYRAEKLRLHTFDFSDLEHEAARLLLTADGEPTAIAREVSERFKEIMMDEYQDTNELQDAICEAISHGNRFLVGDVKQSVYAFRLADPGIFLEKYHRYPDYSSAGASGARKIFLSENFRSQKGVLEAVNAVFTVCMNERLGGLRYDDKDMLRLGCDHTALPYAQTELHCIDSSGRNKHAAEAVFIADRIAQMLNEELPVRGEDEQLRPVRAGDIVILLRSAAKTAYLYIAELEKRGIPVLCDAGQFFLEEPEIESLISLLQTLDNAHQDIPLAAAMLSPLFGFTAQELAELRAAHPSGDLYEAVRASDKTASFINTLVKLRRASQELPLHTLLERIRQETGLEGVYGAMPQGAERLRRLRRFDELTAAYEAGGQRSLHHFLSYLETCSDRNRSAQQGSTDAVRILTVHASKGLEFPVVILGGLSKEFKFKSTEQPLLLDPELGAGCDVYDRKKRIKYASLAKKAITSRIKRQSLAEELRILYVAMTRAKDLLVMTYSIDNVENKLKTIADELVLPIPQELPAQANSLGSWVLMAAALRSEAGELFKERYYSPQVSEQPWLIRLHRSVTEPEAAEARPVTAEPETTEASEIARALHFRYPHKTLSAVPSKITATQLKGRQLDEEVSGGESVVPVRLNEPSFLTGERPLTPTERGTAVHLAMQFLDFSRANSSLSIRKELERMVAQEFITEKQAACVDPEKLLRVFTGELGGLIKSADRVIREFKFSALTDAGEYFPDAAGEKLLLQGVVDCCLFEHDGLSVVDFKTDRLQPGQEAERAGYYRGQLEAYSRALSEIYAVPVRRKLLYFFATDTLFSL